MLRSDTQGDKLLQQVPATNFSMFVVSKTDHSDMMQGKVATKFPIYVAWGTLVKITHTLNSVVAPSRCVIATLLPSMS